MDPVLIAALALIVLAGSPTRPDGMPKVTDGLGTAVDANERFVELTGFAGKAVTVTLRSEKHRLPIGEALLDITLPAGAHTLTEGKPVNGLPPLLLAECSTLNRADGPVVAVGEKGLKVKGPKIYSVFAIEPFPAAFLGERLRMVMDNGAAVFSASTVDVLQVVPEYRYVTIDQLDPESSYRLKVGGKPGVEQVIVALDVPRSMAESGLPADGAWTHTRMVLKGGAKADLPPTRRIALILAGVRGLQRDAFNIDERRVEVTVELVKGKLTAAARPLADPPTAPNKARAFTITVSMQLLASGQPDGARPLLEQCIQQDPRAAECHLLLAQAWQQLGDKAGAVRHACLAWKHGQGELSGANAKELLGGDTSVCPK